MVILAFFAVALFPMCLMAIDGPEEPDAGMQEDTVQLVAPTFENYFSGKFQSTFESWLSKYYPMRSSIVSKYREMQMNIENADVMIQIMNVLKGDTIDPGQQDVACATHTDDDFNGICDVCAKKLYDVPVGPGMTLGGDDNQGGNQGGDDNQGGNQGGDDNQGGNQGGDDNQGGNQGGDDNQGGNQGGDDNQGGNQGGDDN
ncbi:MAG: hypothetical protein IKC97_03310, partial [Clostridia bacterium]|nr:hypothetical protein [Clostridia bacterium]